MTAKPAVRIERATLTFLADLSKHNERGWFEANRTRLNAAQENMRAFVDALLARMRKHDQLATADARDSLMRIYRDLRFAKDRSPYHTRFAGSFNRVKPELRGGYYYHIEPGGSYVACGFFGPEPADLKRIRVDILQDHQTWKRLLSAPAIKKNFGSLIGGQLSTAPRGFPKDHPADDLLRRKQFLLEHAFSDKEVLADDFARRVDSLFKSVRPWFDHMSGVLTTDENGRPLTRGKR